MRLSYLHQNRSYKNLLIDTELMSEGLQNLLNRLFRRCLIARLQIKRKKLALYAYIYCHCFQSIQIFQLSLTNYLKKLNLNLRGFASDFGKCLFKEEFNTLAKRTTKIVNMMKYIATMGYGMKGLKVLSAKQFA